MLTLGLNEETTYASDTDFAGPIDARKADTAEPVTGFWRRQFSDRATSSQKAFDWIFGVILPAVCFFFDPIVFRGDSSPYLGHYKVGVYLFTYVSIMAMAAWLLWRERLGWFSAVLSGIFWAGSAVALAIGIALLPLSLFGLIIVIGALGFTPFFTSIIFARNAVRAFRVSRKTLGEKLSANIVTATALWAVAVPWVVNVALTDRSSVLYQIAAFIYRWV